MKCWYLFFYEQLEILFEMKKENSKYPPLSKPPLFKNGTLNFKGLAQENLL